MEAICYDGDNLQEVINWLEYRDGEVLHVQGEWELDEATGEMVDCRIVDLETVDGVVGLEVAGTWVIYTNDTGIELFSDDHFTANFVEILPDATKAA